MLNIATAPSPILNSICEPCDLNDKSLRKIADEMAELMYSNSGCGLAAPQIGLNKRLVVIDVDWDGEDSTTRNTIVLVNPEIIELKGDPISEQEGCLSCPGINVAVTRQPWARVSFFDLDGDEYELEGDGLLGRCMQHEIDHLNGITLFESCNKDLKLKALQAYDKAKSVGAVPGDVAIEVS